MKEEWKQCDDLFAHMADVANLPLRKKIYATVWGAIFCMGGTIGIAAGIGIVLAVCDAVPVLLEHWFG